jgi:hypothetical protein
MAVGLAGGMAGCATQQPPKITAIGALPKGPDARVTLTDNAAGEAWLGQQQVAACLASQGMPSADKAGYVAQYAVAIRPAKSTVLVGAKAEAPPQVAKHGKPPHGDRIVYSLAVDRLSDGVRVYDLRIDAAYRAKRSTPAGRAAEFCAGMAYNAP